MPQGAAIARYRVSVAKDGERIDSTDTAAGVQTVVPPGAGGHGAYAVTVVAKDAAGWSSSSKRTVVPTS